MFSRSDKTEEVTEAAFAEPSGQRSPMVLAALAGLLAIAGAFLLVWYLNNGTDSEVAADGEASSGAAGATGATTANAATKQVLVVTEQIPRGTSVRELLSAPTRYLSARPLPESAVAASAIESMGQLEELDGLTLSADVLPGEQLLRGRFIDLSTFDNESFLEGVTVVDAPAGHHQVVLTLPASRALGGNIRAGDNVTVIGGFRYEPITEEGERLGAVEISIVVLNSIEVINVQASTEVAGQVAVEAQDLGVASRGSYVITVAVEPDELTDLTYAMEYGNINLAVALPDTDNEGTPRAVTAIDHIIGDDGVWVNELDDGNLVDLLLLPDFQGSSIEVEFVEEGEDTDDGEEDADAADSATLEEGAPPEEESADLVSEEEPSDS